MVENISNIALLIFAKTPIKGKVKTRLIPSLGEEHSTRLYEEMFHHTMNTALESNVNETQIWCLPSTDSDCFKLYEQYERVTLKLQKGIDLGERMHIASNSTLNQFDACVLIGCDCPGLTSKNINLACELLKNVDVVLGPARDGGYYLMAIKKANYSLFNNIEWGKDSVLMKTKKNIKALGLNWQELNTLGDVDRVSDLPLLKKYKIGSYINKNLFSVTT